jgi:hypothetical protein
MLELPLQCQVVLVLDLVPQILLHLMLPRIQPQES